MRDPLTHQMPPERMNHAIHVLTSPQNQELLMTFELVASYLSFKAAACHLIVSETCVSHRIKRLELQLGFTLFIRTTRAIRLTQEGEVILRAYQEAHRSFETKIAHAISPERETLAIYSHPSFMHAWLIPRLRAFRALNPHIQIAVTTGNPPHDFISTSDIDLALYYNLSAINGVNCKPFMGELSLPVCTVEYALSHGLIDKKTARAFRASQGDAFAVYDTFDPSHTQDAAKQLKNCTLLHDSASFHYSHLTAEWQAISELIGFNVCDIPSQLSFDTSMDALQAAHHGLGIAIGRYQLMSTELKNGSLIAPFGLTINTTLPNAYWAITPEHQPLKQSLASFLSWLIQEGQYATQETYDLFGTLSG